MADRFAPGDAVRTSTADPAGHTRLPRYARDAIERMEPAAYLSSSYYEKWFTAITTLLVEKGVATREEIATPEELAGA